jgi:hypothetical protein
VKIIIAIILLLPIFSYAQVHHFNAYQTVIKNAHIGKEYFFDKSKKDDLDSLVVIYLGQIVTTRGKVLRFLTSRWYWGFAPKATSRIVVFNEKNQYLGDYYLTMTYDVPDKIEDKSLVFINDKGSDCQAGLVTRVSFKNGIPKQFFLRCKGEMGDIYSFEQNLF